MVKEFMCVQCDLSMTDVVASVPLNHAVTEEADMDCASILYTKFNIPQPRKDRISRPHLMAKLNESIKSGHRLTLVCAPAGFGKTTLLSDWINNYAATSHGLSNDSTRDVHHEPREKCVWVSLDEADNNQIRFWSVIIRALQAFDAAIGINTLAALKSPQPLNATTILNSLINDITESFIKTTESAKVYPAVLVIDDFHFIQHEEIQNEFAYFVTHLPQPEYGLSLVISTRTEPSLCLHRLRARAQITEIRASDLRFDYHETAEFLNKVVGFQFRPDQITAMETRTEGWIAGLQLAAVTMQAMRIQESQINNEEEFSNFITAFTGSNRYVIDYLAEEIFTRQIDEVQDFLITTSILDKMSGSLCDAVLGSSGSHRMLHLLEQSNLFIESLDQNRNWYRYHRLFVEFLRSRLWQTNGQSQSALMNISITNLYARASQWCENHGLVNEAIKYGLDGKLFPETARIISYTARTLLMQGEAECLLEWIEALPISLVESLPKLYLSKLWGLIITGQLAAVQQHLMRLASLKYDEDRRYLGEIAAVRGFIGILSGDYAEGMVFAQQAHDLLDENDFYLRGMVALNLGRANDILGDITAASLAYDEAFKLGQILGIKLVSLIALSQLGDIKLLQGNLDAAADNYRQAIQCTVQKGEQQPLAGLAYAGLGIVEYERNTLDSAEKYLKQGVDLGLRWENTDVLIYNMVHLAWVYYAQGKKSEVIKLIGEINKGLDGQVVSMPTIGFAHAHLARLAVHIGDTRTAHQWLEMYSQKTQSIPNDLVHTELVTWTQISISDHQSRDVISKLHPAIESVKLKGLIHYEIELMTFLSVAYHSEGLVDLASETFEYALSLGVGRGYKRVYMDNAPVSFDTYILDSHKVEIKNITRQINKEISQPNRVFELEGCLNRHGMSTHPDKPIILEALSQREQEVLQLLSSGLSNKEISKVLYIAVGTVKQHLKNIYSKFDVHSRTEAVYRARAVGMI